MCIACEMAFLDMLDALPPADAPSGIPGASEDAAARFACEAPEARRRPRKPSADERKP